MTGAWSGDLLSVVIPVYNGERFLRQAIDSILRQAYEPLEVIVVDDGSTDASGAVAFSYGPVVAYIRQENSGLGAARNAGVEASSGRILAFLDADDVWTEDKLACQLARLDKDPELECVFGLVDHLHEADVLGRFEVQVASRAGGPIAGTMLIRRESFLRVGPFRTDRRLGEFIDWFARAQDAGLRYDVVQQVVLQRRVHGDNMTIQRASQRSDYLHVLKTTLDRRRAAQE